MKKVLLTTAITMGSICLQAQVNKAYEQAIKDVLTTIQTGWNEKSGEKFSTAFAEVHDYIVVNGLYLKAFTRGQNATIHQMLFDGVYKNSNIRLKLDKITPYSGTLVQVTAIGANYPADQPMAKDPTAIMTMMIEKQADGWKIISFHNHELNMEAIRRASPMPLEVMYASWYNN